MTKRRLAMEKLLAVEPRVRAVDEKAEPTVRAGAVRSMGLSLERLNGPSAEAGERVVELDSALCEPSFVRDRLEDTGDGEGDPTGIAALAESIEEGGQAVPILVRPMPGAAGRYQIAYGHRRWLACKRLGRPVRAVVKPLADEELVIAQGRENNERRDLTFIERAQFSARLVARGVPRAVVMKALGVDKSELARLLAVANGLPEGLAELIGRAPKVGRPRWLKLVALCEGKGTEKALAVAEATCPLGTDARFQAVFDALRETPVAAAPKRKRVERGTFPGRIETRGGETLITLEDAGEESFGAFVAGELETLYAAFLTQRV